MPHRRGILIALVLSCGIAAQEGENKRIDGVLQRSACQTALPGDDPGAPGRRSETPTSDESRREKERRSRRGGKPASQPFQVGGFDISVVLLWLGVGLAVVWLIAAIARSAGERQRERDSKKVPLTARSAMPADVAVDLPDHARFAAAGDFANALRALLRHAIAAWVARGITVPVHATARDLLRRVKAKAFPAESLAHVVVAVEGVHFAGRAADRELYENARDHLTRWEARCRLPT